MLISAANPTVACYTCIIVLQNIPQLPTTVCLTTPHPSSLCRPHTRHSTHNPSWMHDATHDVMASAALCNSVGNQLCYASCTPSTHCVIATLALMHTPANKIQNHLNPAHIPCHHAPISNTFIHPQTQSNMTQSQQNNDRHLQRF